MHRHDTTSVNDPGAEHPTDTPAEPALTCEQVGFAEVLGRILADKWRQESASRHVPDCDETAR